MNITDSKMQSQIQKIINDHEKNKRMYRMILVLLFVTGLSILVLLTVNLPTLSEEEKDILFTIPSDTRKISNTAALLKRYSASNGTLILAIFCTSYLFLQTFAIPGTLFLSILSGALWGKFYGMIVTSLCATIGSSFCFILSKTLLKGWVVRQWPKQIIYLHDKIKKQEKRKRIALETTELYSPLAERLGMHQLKNELQDLSFQVLDPDIRDSILKKFEIIARS